MKKLLLICFVVLGSINMNAQEQGKFRIGLDLGYVLVSDGGGFLGSIEPKFNITDNSNIGFRFGLADTERGDFGSDAYISMLATYDHYFGATNSSLSPFLGIGLGYFALGNFNVDSSSPLDLGEQFGVLIRGGIELGKFRIALEYNILPKTDFEIGDSQSNSYFGVSVGFYLGGGERVNK